MAKYYVKVVGRPFGPIESERIVQMVADGKLTRETEVSANRLDWLPLGEVAELRQALSAGAPSTASFGGVAAYDDAKVWRATNDGVTSYGPMTREEVLLALEQGRLLPTASVWRDGEQARPIADVPEFRTRAVAPVEKKEWYYSPDGQSGYGPYGVSDILAFVEQGRANFDMLVWRLGENSRPMRDEPAFMNAFNAGRPGALAPVPGVSTPYGANDGAAFEPLSREAAESLNVCLRRWHNLMWISYAVSFAAPLFALILLLATMFFGASAVGSFMAGITGVLFFVVCILVTPLWGFSYVPHFVFIYYFWKSIPKRFARTTPGKAMGFLFIPFFNLYWYFVAFLCGSEDIDKALADYARQGRNRGERPSYAGNAGGLVAAICLVVGVATFFPIVFYFCSIKMKKAAIQLNNWRAGGGATVPQNPSGPRVTLDDLIRS